MDESGAEIEVLPKTDKYQEYIERAVETLRFNMDKKSGFFPATDLRVVNDESEANEMRGAWMRDQGFDLLGMMQAQKNLRELEPDNPLIPQIRLLVRESMTLNLATLNKPRFTDKFKQEIKEDESHTYLSSEAPEVHFLQNGEYSGPWDNNQPEAWADYLLAVGEAFKDGIKPNFTAEEKEFIKTVSDYLIRIKPWKFEGSAMWEGLPGYDPSSRSNALAVAKGLDAVLPIFADDQEFSGRISETVQKSVEYVLKEIDVDKTEKIEGRHKGGADLAMIMVMVLPGSERTRMPFLNYIRDNAKELQINSLPGVIRYEGDVYYNVSFGEARWLLGDMALSIGYFNESELARVKGNLVKGEEYEREAFKRLENLEKVEWEFKILPELLMQHDPTHMEGKDNVMLLNDGNRMVALEPLRRSLLWNIALRAQVSALARRALGTKETVVPKLQAVA